MKCPICDNEVKEYSDDYINSIQCEEFARCQDEHHHYAYEFAYGSTTESIGRVTFYSHYDDSEYVRRLRSKQYKAVLELEREHYQKIIKG